MAKKLTKEQFVQKAVNIHGNKYDYSTMIYKTAHDTIEIYCNTCKKYFKLVAYAHTNKKQGCYDCSLLSKSFNRLQERLTALSRHYRDRYLFPDISHTRVDDYITVKCKVHDQEYSHPLSYFTSGQFKPSCCYEEIKRIKRFENFYNKLSEYHKQKYVYNIDSFTIVTEPMSIFCPLHGEQSQKPAVHLKGHECFHCGQETKRLKRITPLEEFKNKATEVHKGFYNYDNVVYNTLYDIVIVTCPVHKNFEIIALNHLKGARCRSCSSKYPKIYDNFSKLLDKYSLEYFVNYRPSWLERKELDIYIPEYNLAIEYNGSAYHHSSKNVSDFLDNTYKSSDYHKNKYDKCKENGINLIHIFEFEDLDQWFDKLQKLFQSPKKYKIIFKNAKRKVNNLIYYGFSDIEIKND